MASLQLPAVVKHRPVEPFGQGTADSAGVRGMQTDEPITVDPELTGATGMVRSRVRAPTREPTMPLAKGSSSFSTTGTSKETSGAANGRIVGLMNSFVTCTDSLIPSISLRI